ILDGFFAYILAFLAVVASAFSVASVLRLRSEEGAGRAESLLATGLSRLQWVLGSLAVTVLATLMNLVLIGLGTGVTHAALANDWGVVGPLLGGILAQAPAVLAVAGVAVLIFGWLPRWVMVAWAVFGFVMLQAYLGGLLQLPDAVSGVSPFWHLPAIPAESFAVAPTLVVSLIALAVGAAGVAGIQRRDIG
ncbi:MAG: hypothetical protein Q8Q44_18420, partial [Nocardioides sp.]|nr:hypothetical protein [Nocardioides sp.]